MLAFSLKDGAEAILQPRAEHFNENQALYLFWLTGAARFAR